MKMDSKLLDEKSNLIKVQIKMIIVRPDTIAKK